MAKFTADVVENTPNFVRRSRGVPSPRIAVLPQRVEVGDFPSPSRNLSLFGAVATGAAGIVDAIDRFNEQRISRQVNQLEEQVNKPFTDLADQRASDSVSRQIFGAGGGPVPPSIVGTPDDISSASQSELSITNSTPKPPRRPTPQGIQEIGSRWSALKQAFDQGEVSLQHYYGTITASIQDLKARFPGYTKEIDQAVRNVFGFDPANALRQQALNDIEAAKQAELKSANDWTKWTQQVNVREYLGLSAEQGNPFSDVYTNPGKYQDPAMQARVRDYVAKQTASDASLDRQKKRLELQNQTDNFYTNRSEEFASQETKRVVNTVLNSSFNQLGIQPSEGTESSSSVYEEIFRLQESQEASPEQVQALNTNLSRLEFQTRNSVITNLQSTLTGDGRSVYDVLGPEQVNDIIDETIRPLEDLRNLLNNKEFGLASLYAREVQMRNERFQAEFQEAAPATARLMAQPQAVRDYILQNPEANASFMSETESYGQALSVVVEGKPLSEALNEVRVNQEMSDTEKDIAARGVVRKVVGLITDSNVDNATKADYIKKVFGTNPDNDPFTLIPEEQYTQLFTLLTSPKMTGSVMKTGDTEAIQSYQSFLINKFTAMPLWRRMAADVTDAETFGRGFDIEWNGELNQLEIKGQSESFFREENIPRHSVPVLNIESTLNTVDTALQQVKFRNAQRGVAELNSALRSVIPMLQATGVPKEQRGDYLLDLIEATGVSHEGEKQNSMIVQIQEAIENFSLGPKLPPQPGDISNIDGLDFFPPIESDPTNSFQEDQQADKSFSIDFTKISLPDYVMRDVEFINEVEKVSNKYNMHPHFLLAAIAFETGGTYNPSIRNASSGATGLIQFIRSTAKSLGTNTNTLSSMSRTEQMKYVDRYFKSVGLDKIENPSFGDVYMSILWPKAVGKPDNTVLFSKGTKAYRQNRGLDLNSDGNITRGEAVYRAATRANRKLTRRIPLQVAEE